MSTDVITETTTDEEVVETGVASQDAALVEEELLVEEVSIDGMCGVY